MIWTKQEWDSYSLPRKIFLRLAKHPVSHAHVPLCNYDRNFIALTVCWLVRACMMFQAACKETSCKRVLHVLLHMIVG